MSSWTFLGFGKLEKGIDVIGSGFDAVDTNFVAASMIKKNAFINVYWNTVLGDEKLALDVAYSLLHYCCKP